MARRIRYQHRFSVRVTAAELAQLHQRARAAQLSLARYLVEAALDDRPLTAQDRAERDRAIYHLRKVGVNLNQVARRLNSGSAFSANALVTALEAVSAAAQRLANPSQGCTCQASTCASK